MIAVAILWQGNIISAAPIFINARGIPNTMAVSCDSAIVLAPCLCALAIAVAPSLPIPVSWTHSSLFAWIACVADSTSMSTLGCQRCFSLAATDCAIRLEPFLITLISASPFARYTWLDRRTVSCLTSDTVSELRLSRRFANTGVNLAGICCAMTIGAGRLAGKDEMISCNVLGPPVDTPIKISSTLASAWRGRFVLRQ